MWNNGNNVSGMMHSLPVRGNKMMSNKKRSYWGTFKEIVTLDLFCR